MVVNGLATKKNTRGLKEMTAVRYQVFFIAARSFEQPSKSLFLIGGRQIIIIIIIIRLRIRILEDNNTERGTGIYVSDVCIKVDMFPVRTEYRSMLLPAG